MKDEDGRNAVEGRVDEAGEGECGEKMRKQKRSVRDKSNGSASRRVGVTCSQRNHNGLASEVSFI